MAEKMEVTQKPVAGESPQPTEDEIRKRAYEIYCERNGGAGSEQDDWLMAETELRKGRATAG
ncbi:DUF2934 domain-containing protein [Candidatus Binatus sp.]|uniref:DUF2934 domain-containing protein n=1 Tax=Candidatus Binatus sp. TaxID=2811406 RepID=UPI003BAF28DA